MHIEVATPVLVVGSYLGCLLGTLWLHQTRRWKIARYILALLLFVPALACMVSGLGLLGTSLNGGYHNPSAASDPSAVVNVIATVICLLGMTLAYFALRLVTRPLKPLEKEKA